MGLETAAVWSEASPTLICMHLVDSSYSTLNPCVACKKLHITNWFAKLAHCFHHECAMQSPQLPSNVPIEQALLFSTANTSATAIAMLHCTQLQAPATQLPLPPSVISRQGNPSCLEDHNRTELSPQPTCVCRLAAAECPSIQLCDRAGRTACTHTINKTAA